MVSKTMARLLEDRTARAVMVEGSPPGWPHEAPVVSLMTLVSVAGDVGRVQVYCQAGDEDPVCSFFTNPTLRDCRVALEEVGETLKTVLMDRVQVRKLMAEGQESPFAVGDWVWEMPSMDVAMPDIERPDGGA